MSSFLPQDLYSLPLFDTPFCIVDLETNGSASKVGCITEIGAVKTCGGELLGEFQTLVHPVEDIPDSIVRLTGITNEMVSVSEPIEDVLPLFHAFAQGCVMVAHNSAFDIGILNANCEEQGLEPFTGPVICTVKLARQAFRGLVDKFNLATLAHHTRAPIEPNHRALQDARATAHVLFKALEHAGSYGVSSLGDLLDFSRSAQGPIFAKRFELADNLPQVPGVYLFKDGAGNVLYVGKANNIRTRVRQYFGNDSRKNIVKLIKQTATITPIRTATEYGALALETDLITKYLPPFNRQGKPSKPTWVGLTNETYPRLSILQKPPRPDREAIGPFPSRARAVEFVEITETALPLNSLSTSISFHKELSKTQYDELIKQVVQQLFKGDGTAVFANLVTMMETHGKEERYEQAQKIKTYIETYIRLLRYIRARRTLGYINHATVTFPKGPITATISLSYNRIISTALIDGNNNLNVNGDTTKNQNNNDLHNNKTNIELSDANNNQNNNELRDNNGNQNNNELNDNNDDTDKKVNNNKDELAITLLSDPSLTADHTPILRKLLLRPDLTLTDIDGIWAEPVAGGKALWDITAKIFGHKNE